VPVTLKDVEHVAYLARLSFSDEEKIRLTRQFNSILDYMDELNTIDTSAVEPLSHVIDLQNVFRDDVRTPGVTREDALRNAPSHGDAYFNVPKVITDR
jgi:aspartyl-tRNA(Asn)/glutamyl-tRNA(Gln) amidotransferase subunit C